MLVTLLSLVFALSALVFVHEMGHYITAKLSGVVVEEFGIGYPPRLFSLGRTRGRLIIGGVEIIIPRKLELPRELGSGSLVIQKTATDDKGRRVLVELEEVDPEDPSAAVADRVEFLDRGTVFSLNAVPFGGFARMLGEEDPTSLGSLASKGKLVRILVLSAGSLMNLLMAVVFFALAAGLGAPTVADPENAVITSVAPGSPAEATILQPGDIIVRADEEEVLTIVGLQAYTQAHLGQRIVLTVQRGEEFLEVPVVPRVNPPTGEGPIGIALAPRTTIATLPWHEALWSGVRQTGYLTGFILSVPVQVVRGLIPAELARPVGPVGVGQLVGDAVQYSIDTGWWYPAMQMMGTLSVALAVTNLLPLPGLDGGRVLFVIVEGIRGRRVDPSKEGVVHLIGLALMVALLLFITWQDLINPVPPVDWSSFF